MPAQRTLLSTLLVASTFVTSHITAQPGDPATVLAEADRLAMLYNWPKAAPLYAQAETLFSHSGDKRNAAYARLGWIWAQADTGAAPKLEDEVEEQMGNPLVRGDAKLMLRCLVTKAAIDQEKNEASARDIWEKILAVAKGLGDKRWEARAQAELGVIAFMDGDVEKASGMLKTALVSSYLLGDLGAAIYYGSIVGNGLVEVGQPEPGLEYCETALKTAAAIKDMGFPFMAYEGKARSPVALHREAEAEQVLNLAIQQARGQGARAAEAQLLIVMGKQAAVGNLKQSIEYLKAATSLSKEAGFHHAFAWSTLELAKVYRNEGDLDNAQKYVTESIEAMQEVQDKYHLPGHLALLAELEAKKGELARAEALYERAADVVEGLLINVPSRQVESSLIATESQLYLDHFRLAATKLRNVNRAYEVLETARGRSIADALRSEPVRPFRTDPITEAGRKEVNRIQLVLLHETNRNQRANLLERLFQAEQVLAPVGKPKSRLQRAAIYTHPVGLTALRRSLRPDEMLLEYILDEPSSFCLHITRESAAVTVLPAGRGRIEDLIERHLAELRSKKSSAETGENLYSLLVWPIPGQESKSRLIIGPDGKLHLLPFGALPDLQGRYFLESHIVTYAPSATVLYLIRNSRIVHPPTQVFLGVGDVQHMHDRTLPTKKNSGTASASTATSVDPFDLAGTRLQDIPSTRDEVIAARQVFGGNRLLLGEDATEAAFKAQPLADFKIIHIAAHGIASAKFPDRAALVLGVDPKSGEDGLLQVREIRDLSLTADLVTLSACDAGVGALEGEEGIANLVRAFLFAGAKSVVASLWAASDVYTRNLMQRFYSYIADGEDKGSALRHAQMDLISEFGDQAVPFYWAGFVMVGDGSSSIPISRKGPHAIAPGKPVHIGLAPLVERDGPCQSPEQLYRTFSFRMADE